jgi:hypothetical protein
MQDERKGRSTVEGWSAHELEELTLIDWLNISTDREHYPPGILDHIPQRIRDEWDQFIAGREQP